MRRTLFVGLTWLLLCAPGFAQTLGTITGEVRITERGRLRSGLRHSAAKIAMYSNPHSAPKVILLNTLNVKTESGGMTRRNGLNRAAGPCA